SSPSCSPVGRTVAMNLSKDGNPEISLLTVATGAFRRLTTNVAIDTEPTWSPTGRDLAFISDRSGSPHVYVMDIDGVNVRRLTNGGDNKQPRRSPQGDTIVFTPRFANHDLWGIHPHRPHLRRLPPPPRDNQSAPPAPPTRRPRRQRERLLGSQRPPPHLPVVPPGGDTALHDACGRVGTAGPHRRAGTSFKSSLVTTTSVIGLASFCACSPKLRPRRM